MDPGTSLVEQCNIALHGKASIDGMTRRSIWCLTKTPASVNFEHSMYDGSIYEDCWMKRG